MPAGSLGALAVPAAGTTALASPSMNENEGSSAYPPNPDVKSGPSLIAGFHALSCTSPSYYNPYRGSNKNTLSVDMVRLSLTFKGDRGEWLSRKGAQLTDCDEMNALRHRPFPCPSLRVREGCGSDSHGRGTTTSPMGIRYPIPIRRGGLEGFHPSISAEPSGQGRGAATDDAQQSRPLGGLRRSHGSRACGESVEP